MKKNVENITKFIQVWDENGVKKSNLVGNYVPLRRNEYMNEILELSLKLKERK